MSWLGQGIVTTPDGVYRPPPLQLNAALFALALVFIAVSFGLRRIAPAYACLYLALLAVPFIVRVREYRRFGALGRPMVAIVGGTLVFARPEDSRGALNFEIADLQQLQVYGRAGRRTYRFLRRDGSCVETVPLWGPRVEACVLQWLQAALPQRVTVAEPQTLFESIRGDGP